MPHFRTWDDIYYDYHGGADLTKESDGETAEDVLAKYAIGGGISLLGRPTA